MPAITEERFYEVLGGFQATAFRLELQREYAEPTEVENTRLFAEGNPQDPAEVPALASWYASVRALTAAGRVMERVRVVDEPPTLCQQWLRWTGAWNIAAGERMRYMPRSTADALGFPPPGAATDFWLLDDGLPSQTLIVMAFRAGRRVWTGTPTDPDQLHQARTWRNLALDHSVLDVESAIPAT